MSATIKSAAALLAVALLSACTHSLHVAHYSDFNPTYASYGRGEMVEAEASQFVIMGFIFQTDYVNEAYDRIQRQCPGGRIQGIETQYTSDHGFMSWTNRIHMQGLCVPNRG